MDEILEAKSPNRENDANSDVKVRGFWRNQQNAHFEFRVFYPFASCHISCKTVSLQNNQEKHVKDNGGIRNEMRVSLEHLAAKLAIKCKEKYTDTITTLICKFNVAIMRSVRICLRCPRLIKPTSMNEQECTNSVSTLIANDAGL